MTLLSVRSPVELREGDICRLHTVILRQGCNKGPSVSRLCFFFYLTLWTSRAFWIYIFRWMTQTPVSMSAWRCVSKFQNNNGGWLQHWGRLAFESKSPSLFQEYVVRENGRQVIKTSHSHPAMLAFLSGLHTEQRGRIKAQQSRLQQASVSGDTAKEGGVLLCYLVPGAGMVLLGFLRLLWPEDEEGITLAFLWSSQVAWGESSLLWEGAGG